MIRKLYTLSFLLCLPTFLFAQLKQDTKVDMAKALTQPTKIQSIIGLIGLDPNKFSMSHSYSLSFTTFGGHSFSQGLYLNTMKYQLSNPITMYLQVGFLHQPLGDLGQNSLLKNQLFLSGAGLEYKPSENFKLQFEFSQQPNLYYSPYSRFYHRNSWLQREEDKN
ncbi:MAG: hypothetical protein ACE5HX_02130 [bacterium]